MIAQRWKIWGHRWKKWVTKDQCMKAVTDPAFRHSLSLLVGPWKLLSAFLSLPSDELYPYSHCEIKPFLSEGASYQKCDPSRSHLWKLLRSHVHTLPLSFSSSLSPSLPLSLPVSPPPLLPGSREASSFLHSSWTSIPMLYSTGTSAIRKSNYELKL